ncbi:FTR1 family iron permease [Calothrix rhizosoleniae]|uniref:FTR1 family iron permease n=1 Tax=Calothrix rhizosoleniae TaxID=888997 RepID=UPI000B49CEAA|nr:FTR1 family protein [Calothrix rhizosoleniae]
MDFSTALPTFVITLREGVEAALVVGIVLALLQKAEQSRLNPWVYAGVVVGILVSGLVGVLFSWLIPFVAAIKPQYSSVVKPWLEATFCILAIAMLSWMLIWMTRQARFMKANVEGAVNQALQNPSNGAWGIFSLILIAVVREGFETVLFIAANFQQGLVSAFGALAGLALAAFIGSLLFNWGIKIDIRRFFQVMGVLLILIVAGLVVTALKNFDQGLGNLALSSHGWGNLCFYYEKFTKVHSCILGPLVWNTSQILPERQFPGIIFKSLLGYRQHLYLVQAVGYVGFLISIGGLYFRSLGGGVSTKADNLSTNKISVKSAKD